MMDDIAAEDAGSSIADGINQHVPDGMSVRVVDDNIMVDFETVIKDPSNPRMMLAAYNITDQLHPNDVGYKAMADSIDLSIFGVKGGVKKK